MRRKNLVQLGEVKLRCYTCLHWEKEPGHLDGVCVAHPASDWQDNLVTDESYYCGQWCYDNLTDKERMEGE